MRISDWSSDVCSSDLLVEVIAEIVVIRDVLARGFLRVGFQLVLDPAGKAAERIFFVRALVMRLVEIENTEQRGEIRRFPAAIAIGVAEAAFAALADVVIERAACRDRGGQYE